MSFFSDIASILRGGWRSYGAGKDQSPPFIATSTDSGVIITPSLALKLPVVWACIGLRSEVLASLPFNLIDDDKAIVKNHPLYSLLHHSPNADMSAYDFWQCMQTAEDLWGNAYAEISRAADGRIVALTPLDSEKITVVRNTNGQIEYRDATRPLQILTQRDIFHLKGVSVDGLVGMSCIQYQAQTMGDLVAANRAASREFLMGLKVGGFLKTGQSTLTDTQRERLREGLANFRKPENSGSWMVLEAGMEPVTSAQMKLSPVDAQLLESRQMGAKEICAAFRIPPQIVGYGDSKASSWASSLETTKLGLLAFTFNPILQRRQQAIAKQLMTPVERLTLSAKFSREGLLQADVKSRAAFYVSMLQNGVFTRNEVRELEDLPAMDGGDELTVQLNMTPLNLLGPLLADDAAATAAAGAEE